MRIVALLAAALFALPNAGPFVGPSDITLDFSKDKLPDGWTISAKEWKVKDGQLVGIGDGALDWAGPITGDFTLQFKGWSAEKTNFEVKLYDVATGEELYTFAFLGRYHTVLDGVKCCMLKGGGFVKVDSKMWIFPGRTFTFEVRSAKAQLQMFLDGELGPVFIDPQPPAPAKGMKMKILASTEGSKDEIRLDDVKVALAAPKK
jgi:hypothetical protein